MHLDIQNNAQALKCTDAVLKNIWDSLVYRYLFATRAGLNQLSGVFTGRKLSGKSHRTSNHMAALLHQTCGAIFDNIKT